MNPPECLTARDVARLVGGVLEGPGDGTLSGVAPLEQAKPSDLSFLASSSYLSYFQRTSAGAVLLSAEFRGVSGGPASRIVVPDARAAVAQVLSRMHPETGPAWGLDSTAKVERGARWAGRIAVGPGAVLGAGARLGADCVIGPFVSVGRNCQLGDGCRIEAHAVLYADTVLGHRVTVRAGARVGGHGFGFVSDGAAHLRMPHGRPCVLEDGVDVGANSTIDRGSVRDTVIGAGTKIDSQVHVGHNVRIGARCLIMAQVGIGGSTDVESDVVLAGQAGIAGHLRVGAGARIGAQAGVIGDIEPGATVSGYPARRHRDVLRQVAALKRLTPLVDVLERQGEPGAIAR